MFCRDFSKTLRANKSSIAANRKTFFLSTTNVRRNFCQHKISKFPTTSPHVELVDVVSWKIFFNKDGHSEKRKQIIWIFALFSGIDYLVTSFKKLH